MSSPYIRSSVFEAALEIGLVDSGVAQWIQEEKATSKGVARNDSIASGATSSTGYKNDQWMSSPESEGFSSGTQPSESSHSSQPSTAMQHPTNPRATNRHMQTRRADAAPTFNGYTLTPTLSISSTTSSSASPGKTSSTASPVDLSFPPPPIAQDNGFKLTKKFKRGRLDSLRGRDDGTPTKSAAPGYTTEPDQQPQARPSFLDRAPDVERPLSKESKSTSFFGRLRSKSRTRPGTSKKPDENDLGPPRSMKERWRTNDDADGERQGRGTTARGLGQEAWLPVPRGGATLTPSGSSTHPRPPLPKVVGAAPPPKPQMPSSMLPPVNQSASLLGSLAQFGVNPTSTSPPKMSPVSAAPAPSFASFANFPPPSSSSIEKVDESARPPSVVRTIGSGPRGRSMLDRPKPHTRTSGFFANKERSVGPTARIAIISSSTTTTRMRMRVSDRVAMLRGEGQGAVVRKGSLVRKGSTSGGGSLRRSGTAGRAARARSAAKRASMLRQSVVEVDEESDAKEDGEESAEQGTPMEETLLEEEEPEEGHHGGDKGAGSGEHNATPSSSESGLDSSDGHATPRQSPSSSSSSRQPSQSRTRKQSKSKSNPTRFPLSPSSSSGSSPLITLPLPSSKSPGNLTLAIPSSRPGTADSLSGSGTGRPGTGGSISRRALANKSPLKPPTSPLPPTPASCTTVTPPTTVAPWSVTAPSSGEDPPQSDWFDDSPTLTQFPPAAGSPKKTKTPTTAPIAPVNSPSSIPSESAGPSSRSPSGDVLQVAIVPKSRSDNSPSPVTKQPREGPNSATSLTLTRGHSPKAEEPYTPPGTEVPIPPVLRRPAGTSTASRTSTSSVNAEATKSSSSSRLKPTGPPKSPLPPPSPERNMKLPVSQSFAALRQAFDSPKSATLASSKPAVRLSDGPRTPEAGALHDATPRKPGSSSTPVFPGSLKISKSFVFPNRDGASSNARGPDLLPASASNSSVKLLGVQVPGVRQRAQTILGRGEASLGRSSSGKGADGALQPDSNTALGLESRSRPRAPSEATARPFPEQLIQPTAPLRVPSKTASPPPEQAKMSPPSRTPSIRLGGVPSTSVENVMSRHLSSPRSSAASSTNDAAAASTSGSQLTTQIAQELEMPNTTSTATVPLLPSNRLLRPLRPSVRISRASRGTNWDSSDDEDRFGLDDLVDDYGEDEDDDMFEDDREQIGEREEPRTKPGKGLAIIAALIDQEQLEARTSPTSPPRNYALPTPTSPGMEVRPLAIASSSSSPSTPQRRPSRPRGSSPPTPVSPPSVMLQRTTTAMRRKALGAGAGGSQWI